NHPDVVPGFFPQAYLPYEEYTNRDGFFLDENNQPVIVEDQVITREKEEDEDTLAFDPEKEQEGEGIDRQTGEMTPEELREALEPMRKKKAMRIPEMPKLTFDFRHLFHNKVYEKYKDIL